MRTAWLLMCVLILVACAAPPKRIAAIVTEYRHNAHADVIVGRLVESHNLNGKGEYPNLKLVSLYTDQVPPNDTSRALMKANGIPIFNNIAGALTLGTGKLAVDGVLLVAEHGQYPSNASGNVIWPKRRMFEAIAKVFRESNASVPIFCDKHLADNWRDAKWLYDTARELKAPLMAGSSLPVLWRRPAADVRRGTELTQMVAISYHTLSAYGFHAVEMVQCLAERRHGGETGVRQVRCLKGDAVWAAVSDGTIDESLLQAAVVPLEKSPVKHLKKSLRELAKEPTAMIVDYRDGFRASIVTLNGAAGEWSVAWHEDGDIKATMFWTQEARPFAHFTHLVKGIEEMFHNGRPTWPPERTLYSSAILDAAMRSLKDGGRVVPTPYLDLPYQATWNWRQPPPPPPGRPIPDK
tara:strand:+ start:1858 stop:3084 length:1227 start_codon:yes stop_codon:yes gene_type:complete